MKNYQKGLLAVMVLTAMGLMAAEDKTIYVTTFADEDGENSNACSLREAIKTAKLDKSYGGCAVGRRLANDGSAADVIQLEAGEYKLNRELVVESAVNIQGKSAYSYIEKSPITNNYPLREALSTTISGQGKTRLFNSIESHSSINVYDLILKDAYSQGNGAAFYVAGALTINNSEIVNAQSKSEGAAIYAAALNSELGITINNSLLQQNNAEKLGSVVAMDCQGNLGTTQTSISISNSSLVNNGSQNSQSIIDLCGYATLALSNNTIAKNTTSHTGHIIQMTNQVGRPLHAAASLSALSNTIVENTARSVLYYDNVGAKSLAYNILAYNNALSCEYALNAGKPTLEQKVSFGRAANAIQTTGPSRCVLPDLNEEQKSTDLDISGSSMSSLLSAYLKPSVDSRYLGMYYPRDNKTATDLVDVGYDGCAATDQRGIDRVVGSTLLLDPNAQNSCDIGAIETRRLTAADIVDLRNVSLVSLLDGYQQNIDQLKVIIEDKDTLKIEIPSLKDELKEYEDLLKYTQKYQKYRAIYIDPFSLAMPQEVLNGNSVQVKVLNAQNYEVSTKSIGVGLLEGSGDSMKLNGEKDPALKCEWKADFGRIIMYRTDDTQTSATDFEYCSYTLKDKKTGASSAGILRAGFVNIAPIAKNDQYSINPANNLIVTANLLENDSDNGDGPISTLSTEKSVFYKNDAGLETPIRIVNPAAGLSIQAERQGACPGTYQRDICYGGDIRFAVKNNLSQYDYHMEYQVFDADALISNTATISLKNTVKNTNTSSGGGSTGLFALLGLLGLVACRRLSNK